MDKLVLITALLLAASSAAAQQPNGQTRSATQGGALGSTQAPTTGVFCIEEMTANFCNVVGGPNTGGYGARSGSATSNGAGGGTSSIPPCPSQPPFNELCN